MQPRLYVMLVALVVICVGWTVVATEPIYAAMSYGSCECRCDCEVPNPLMQCNVPIYTGCAHGGITKNCGSGPGGYCQW
jgi:hypothetical protein